MCVSGQPGEAAPEGPGIPGLGTPPIPLRLRLGAAPGHDPLSHCVSCVWKARQPRGPIGAATKQLGPVLLGGRTHMAAARPASGLTREMGRAPTCRAVTGVGWNTVGFQKHEPPSAHVNSENPKTGRRHSPPLPEKTPGPRVRPAARVSLASPDCAPVSPPLKAVKPPLLTKKVPPIFKKKRQSSYAWFVGRAAAGAQRDPSGQAHLGGRRGGVVAQQVLALRAPGPPSACQGH